MKLIIAVIQPHRLESVREALAGLGVQGMTASEVQGYGRQGGHREIYRGAEYEVHFTPKTKIEVVVRDSDEERAVEAIQAAARTGRIGDGKLFVVDVTRTVRIRTGEEGDDAL